MILTPTTSIILYDATYHQSLTQQQSSRLSPPFIPVRKNSEWRCLCVTGSISYLLYHLHISRRMWDYWQPRLNPVMMEFMPHTLPALLRFQHADMHCEWAFRKNICYDSYNIHDHGPRDGLLHHEHASEHQISRRKAMIAYLAYHR